MKRYQINTSQDKFHDLVERSGLYMMTWSPGDGITRYRFYRNPVGGYTHEDGIFTALGRKEAMTFLQGFIKGKY